MRASSKLRLLVPVLVLSACPVAMVDEPHLPVPGLESPAMDAGELDASFEPDASFEVDSGAPVIDAGTAHDAGVGHDAGTSSIDAGAAHDAGTVASCGDGVCSATESCSSCARDCGSCCSSAGGLSCGGNGIVGDPSTLYRCDGTRYVKDQVCAGACVALPSGVPDRCPLGASPTELVTRLSPTPYVESSCVATTYAGWPYAAKRCTYTSGPITTSVTVADPTPAVVAKWVVDASAFIPRLRALQTAHPTEWVQGLDAIATHMLLQSSRIYPLSGGIIEDMGGGYVNYPFLNGVTQGCSTGCYCRINSLHRTTYCAWRGAMTSETEAACLARVGTSGLTTAWGHQCLQNHIDSWTRDWNEHFRAMAWKANQSVAASCPAVTSCTPAQVVTAVRTAYGL